MDTKNGKQMKAVYVIRDNGNGGSFWTKVGNVRTNISDLMGGCWI